MVFKGLAALSDYFLTVVIFAVLSCGKSKMVTLKLSNPHQIKYRHFAILEVVFFNICKKERAFSGVPEKGCN